MSTFQLKRIFKKILIFITVISVFFSFSHSKKVYAKQIYYIGGHTAGFILNEEGVDVLAVTEVLTDKGLVSPAKDADIRLGDIILSLNENKIKSGLDLEKNLSLYNNGLLTAQIKRNGKIILKDITPAKDINGKYRLGLIVRDAVTGIGTITYYDSNGNFSALGHPIYRDGYELLEISGGKIFTCMIIGVDKGVKGYTGELKGIFSPSDEIGVINSNGNVGITGKVNEKISDKEVEIGKAKQGSALIYCCVDGTEVKEYSVSIVKTDYSEKNNKNFVIKITDKQLIEKTGGIIQGMSGSPIVQNGKLVGAITHVFVNDPQRGYGIAIEKMINE